MLEAQSRQAAPGPSEGRWEGRLRMAQQNRNTADDVTPVAAWKAALLTLPLAAHTLKKGLRHL
jgi:hypothetical protein